MRGVRGRGRKGQKGRFALCHLRSSPRRCPEAFDRTHLVARFERERLLCFPVFQLERLLETGPHPEPVRKRQPSKEIGSGARERKCLSCQSPCWLASFSLNSLLSLAAFLLALLQQQQQLTSASEESSTVTKGCAAATAARGSSMAAISLSLFCLLCFRK